MGNPPTVRGLASADRARLHSRRVRQLVGPDGPSVRIPSAPPPIKPDAALYCARNPPSTASVCPVIIAAAGPTQLVSHQNVGREAVLFEQLAHQFHGVSAPRRSRLTAALPAPR